MTENTRKLLDQKLPIRTAGALPSSRTEDMLADALASDNIDAVKAQLIHVWAHYQSLEFALNTLTLPDTAEAFRETAREDGLQDEDPIEVTLRAIAGPLLEAAYDTAHQIGLFLSLGVTAPNALRTLYADLDYSDPEREVTKADEELLAEWERELRDTEDGDK